MAGCHLQSGSGYLSGQLRFVLDIDLGSVGWSWDARVMGMWRVFPRNWGWSGMFAAAQSNYIIRLNMLTVIGGNLHIQFESSVLPVVDSDSPFVT